MNPIVTVVGVVDSVITQGDTTLIARLKVVKECRGCGGDASVVTSIMTRDGRSAWLSPKGLGGSDVIDDTIELHYVSEVIGPDVITIEFAGNCNVQGHVPNACLDYYTYTKYSVDVRRPNAGVRTTNEQVEIVRINGSVVLLSLQNISEQKLYVYTYDLTGRLVRQIERDVPTGTSEIDLGASNLPEGCYWYIVRGNGWSKSGKVMKLP